MDSKRERERKRVHARGRRRGSETDTEREKKRGMGRRDGRKRKGGRKTLISFECNTMYYKLFASEKQSNPGCERKFTVEIILYTAKHYCSLAMQNRAWDGRRARNIVEILATKMAPFIVHSLTQLVNTLPH